MGQGSPGGIDGVALMSWAPCPWCWGNGTVLKEAGNGEGLVPCPCPNCAGAGQVLR